MSFKFWNNVLLGIGLAIVGLGLFLVFGTSSALFEVVFNNQIDPLFWPDEGKSELMALFQSWVYGVLGATMVGWGAIIFFTGFYAFPRRELWAWNAICYSTLAWFVLDTYISIAAGVYFNALFNTLILAAAAVPLAMTRKHMVTNI
jgi:hypothetical protein